MSSYCGSGHCMFIFYVLDFSVSRNGYVMSRSAELVFST